VGYYTLECPDPTCGRLFRSSCASDSTHCRCGQVIGVSVATRRAAGIEPRRRSRRATTTTRAEQAPPPSYSAPTGPAMVTRTADPAPRRGPWDGPSKVGDDDEDKQPGLTWIDALSVGVNILGAVKGAPGSTPRQPKKAATAAPAITPTTPTVPTSPAADTVPRNGRGRPAYALWVDCGCRLGADDGNVREVRCPKHGPQKVTTASDSANDLRPGPLPLAEAV
jgi:hypothetical protein